MPERHIGPRAPTFLEVAHCSSCGFVNPAPKIPEVGAQVQVRCRGCFKNFALSEANIFLKPAHYYWTVTCGGCGFIIALGETRHQSDISDVARTVPGFKAYCLACKSDFEYSGSDVVLWAGPPPTVGFIAHPSFVKMR